jgi:hypothetical protein
LAGDGAREVIGAEVAELARDGAKKEVLPKIADV